MHERIQEISLEAGVSVGQLFSEMLCNDIEVNIKIAELWNAQPEEVRKRIFQVIEEKQAKFASLIIQECTMLVDGFELMQEVADGEYVDYEASAVLKQHFGVK